MGSPGTHTQTLCHAGPVALLLRLLALRWSLRYAHRLYREESLCTPLRWEGTAVTFILPGGFLMISKKKVLKELNLEGQPYGLVVEGATSHVADRGSSPYPGSWKNAPGMCAQNPDKIEKSRRKD